MEYTHKLNCLNILAAIDESVELLQERNRAVQTVDDYLCSPAGMEKLDANCMRLQTIGENVKRFDMLTDHAILPKFNGVEWSQIIRMRDFISHHYDGVDPDIVLDIIKHDLPRLQAELKRVREAIE